MDKKVITTAVKEALKKEKAKKRKFLQSVELAVNFKNVKIESEDKLNLTLVLPKGRGKDTSIGVFAEGDMAVRAKKLTKYILSTSEINDYTKSKRKMRKFANSCEFFIAQPDMMANIGKKWGIVLGPRGKMPQPVPPTADLEPVFGRLKNTVAIRSKKNPTVHVPIGTEDMSPGDLVDNALAVLDAVEQKITMDKFDSMYVKTTMGETVRVE